MPLASIDQRITAKKRLRAKTSSGIRTRMMKEKRHMGAHLAWVQTPFFVLSSMTSSSVGSAAT